MSEIWNEIARRVRARLVQEERERIIKLIEENMDHWDGWLDVKELIKGEQK